MRQRIKPIRAQGNRPRVLVIDDEPEMCRCLEKCLALLDCDVESCTSGAAGLARLEKHGFDIVLTDLRMPGMDGIEVVKAVRRISADTNAIVLTAYGTIDSAVQALHSGAANYLTKPFKLDELRVAIERVLTPAASGDSFNDELIGQSPAIKKLRSQIDQVAATPSTVLISGETGVGKELVARAIHARSNRRLRPFVAVNCGAIQQNLLESDLFGHEKGAFTGAVRAKRGRVEAANHGTLFLDEIAETSRAFQVSLLRVLEQRELVRVGGTQPIKVDFRLITATNKDLRTHVKEKRFREDLYYRLNVVPLAVPPLRDHAEDIPLLVEHFIKKHRPWANKKIRGMSPEAMMALTIYSWPGNVRQLENTVEKAMVLATGTIIMPDDLPAEITSGDCPDGFGGYLDAPFREAKDGFERAYLETRLQKADGNISEAARKAHLARPYFHERLRKHGIDPQQFRTQ